jgi:hypothetical protein
LAGRLGRVSQLGLGLRPENAMKNRRDKMHSGKAARITPGLEALQDYRRSFNETLQEFTATPIHDWTSHAADAFRYLAVKHRPPAEAAARVVEELPGPGAGRESGRVDALTRAFIQKLTLVRRSESRPVRRSESGPPEGGSFYVLSSSRSPNVTKRHRLVGMWESRVSCEISKPRRERPTSEAALDALCARRF